MSIASKEYRPFSVVKIVLFVAALPTLVIGVCRLIWVLTGCGWYPELVAGLAGAAALLALAIVAGVLISEAES
jgi:hypothetical protein